MLVEGGLMIDPLRVLLLTCCNPGAGPIDLELVHPGKNTSVAQKPEGVSLLNYPSICKNDDVVGTLDRGQSVGYDDYGPSFPKVIERVLDGLLGNRV